MSDLVARLKAEKEEREKERQIAAEEQQAKRARLLQEFEAYWSQARVLTGEFHAAVGTRDLLIGVQEAFLPRWALTEVSFAGQVGTGSCHGFTLTHYAEGEGNDLEPLVPASFQGLLGFFVGLVSEYLPRNYPQPSYILTHFGALLVKCAFDESLDGVPTERELVTEVRRYVGINDGDCIGYLEFLFGEATAPQEQQIPRLRARLHDPQLIEAARHKGERVVEETLRATWSKV